MNKKNKIWIFIILIIILILSFSVKNLIDNKNINITQANKEIQKDNKKDDKNKKCPKNYPVCAYSETILDYCPNCGVSKNIKTYKNPCLAKKIGAEVLYKGECKKNRYNPDGDIIGIDPEAKFKSRLINEKTKKELERRIKKEKQAEADYYKNSPVCALSSLYPDCSNCKSIEFPKTYPNYKEAKENSPLILYKGTCNKTDITKTSKEQQNNKKEKQAKENYYKNSPVCALSVGYPDCLGCKPIVFPQTYKNYKETELDDVKKILHKGPCLEKEEI